MPKLHRKLMSVPSFLSKRGTLTIPSQEALDRMSGARTAMNASCTGILSIVFVRIQI